MFFDLDAIILCSEFSVAVDFHVPYGVVHSTKFRHVEMCYNIITNVFIKQLMCCELQLEQQSKFRLSPQQIQSNTVKIFMMRYTRVSN